MRPKQYMLRVAEAANLNTSTTMITSHTTSLAAYLNTLALEAGNDSAATAEYKQRLLMIVHHDNRPVLVSIEAIVQVQDTIVGLFNANDGQFNRIGVLDHTTGIFNLQNALFSHNPQTAAVYVAVEEEVIAYHPGARAGFVNPSFSGIAGPIFSGGTGTEIAGLQRFIVGGGHEKPRLATYTIFRHRLSAGWVINQKQP